MAALTYADRVKETTATTGTGTITLAGAASGFQAFSVIGNGSKCYYRIEDGTAWEIGIGTYTSSGTTLSRDVILASTNSGSALNLSGTATVYHDIPAVFFKDQVRHVQARVAATANVTLATACENGDTLNGVVLATGDVIFTPYQSTAADKRLWVVKASGAPDPHPLMPTGDVISAFLVTVSEGTSEKDRIWLQTANTVTVGSGSPTWSHVNAASSAAAAGTALRGPISGSDDTPTMRADVLSDLPSAVQGWSCNHLLNSSFRTFGHSYTTGGISITDGAYSGPTAWYFLASNTTCSIGQGTGIGNSASSIIITNGSASTRRVGTAQAVEYYDCINNLRGKQVTFQVACKRSSTGNVRVAILEWTGTANAPTKDIVNDWTSSTFTTGNFFISTSYSVLGVSSAVSVGTSATNVNVTATVGSSANNIIVFAWTDDLVAASGTFEVSEAQLVKGAYPAVYEIQPYPIEIVLCDYRCRMHWSDANQTDAILGWGHGASTTVAVCQVPLGHPMRVVPSLSYTAADWQVADSVGARQDVTTLAISSTVSSRRIMFMTSTVASGLTVGRGMATLADTTAGRFLVFDAEIGV